jgi:hypothetical protein
MAIGLIPYDPGWRNQSSIVENSLFRFHRRLAFHSGFQRNAAVSYLGQWGAG